MPTQNWTFRLDDETQNNAEPTQLLEQLAVTRECPIPLEVQLAAARATAAHSAPAAAAAGPAPTPTAAATGKPVATVTAATQPAAVAPATPACSQKPTAAPASTTMHAYVPPGSQLGPLPVAARAALQGAQSQLKGSVPMLLADHAAAPAVASQPAKPATKPAENARAQPILLAGVAALVLAAAVWNFYPGSPRAGRDAGGLRATAASAHSSASTPSREEAPVPCLADSTQYRSSAERDELLRNAIGEFGLGRLERAHALLKEYQQVGCDRATLEALSILERQLTQKTRDH